MTKEHNHLSAYQSLSVGALTGVCDSFSTQPLFSIKNRVQGNLPFSLKPSILYKGFSINFINILAAYTSQIGLSHMIHNIFSEESNNNSNAEKMTSAFAGGAFSSVISTPIEGTIAQMHKHKFTSPFELTKLPVNINSSFLYQGIAATALRDSIYTFAFLGAYPALQTKFQSKYDNEFLSSYAAGITLGIGAGTASHPFDMIRASQQFSADIKKISFFESARKIYTSEGAMGFMKGFPARAALLSCSITVAGTISKKLEEYFLSTGNNENTELSGEITDLSSLNDSDCN